MILAGTSFLLTLLVIEWIYRYFRIPAEITRKLAHVACGYLVLYWSERVSFTEYCVLLTVFLGIFLLEKRFHILRSLHDIGRPSIGDITYLAGLYVLGIVYYGTPLFAVGLLVMVIPDAVAGILTFTRGTGKKDLIHSGIVSICCFLLLIWSVPVESVLVIAVAVAVVERFSSYGLDNVTVPVAYYFVLKMIV